MSQVAVLNPHAVLLPRCCGAQPEALCTCGGSFLAYVTGGYVHVAICAACLPGGKPCPTPEHVACSEPEPRVCPHGTCRRVCDPYERCSQPGDEQGGCCGCCWIVSTC